MLSLTAHFGSHVSNTCFWTTCAQLFHNLVSFRHQHFLLLLVIHNKWREGVQTTFAEVGLNVGFCMLWYGANKQTIIIEEYILNNLEIIDLYFLADFRKLVAPARTWMITSAVSPWSWSYLDPTATRCPDSEVSGRSKSKFVPSLEYLWYSLVT